MEHDTTENIQHGPAPQYRAPHDDHSRRNAVRDGGGSGGARHRAPGGLSAAIGETDVILYRSYAIVERLREAVAARHENGI